MTGRRSMRRGSAAAATRDAWAKSAWRRGWRQLTGTIERQPRRAVFSDLPSPFSPPRAPGLVPFGCAFIILIAHHKTTRHRLESTAGTQVQRLLKENVTVCPFSVTTLNTEGIERRGN